MNYVHLIGRLAFDVELKEVGESVVVNNRLAVPRDKDKTDFFDIVAWNTEAKLMEKYYKKGYEVAISGHLSMKPRKIGDKEYSFTVVTVDRISFTYGNPRTVNADTVAERIMNDHTVCEETKGILE